LIPNFDSVYTLIAVFFSAITSILLNLTLDWEDFEHTSREDFYKREYSHFSTLSEAIQTSAEILALSPRARELLKDYNFR
jgi:hypothetical protein